MARKRKDEAALSKAKKDKNSAESKRAQAHTVPVLKYMKVRVSIEKVLKFMRSC